MGPRRRRAARRPYPGLRPAHAHRRHHPVRRRQHAAHGPGLVARRARRLPPRPRRQGLHPRGAGRLGAQRAQDRGVLHRAGRPRAAADLRDHRTGHRAARGAGTGVEGLAGNPGFEQISLGAFDGPAPGSDAAQLVYAYDSERLGTRVKVVDCAFTTDDGRQFAVLVLGTEADWPLQQETQRIALQAFSPEG
ncbi:hypothetical protein [Streptomyces endophytica]|uniref:Uncharacterized protein n=1 Tax=Streptomyces endophytica TaxID=2991496 RepID=A0ABY6P821_9ACTN|nr:hypothetical protein [Streptomyces endophytica]UZJ29938.1 hypothetical protein OJ254_05210 [Streptomyces endophytica]